MLFHTFSPCPCILKSFCSGFLKQWAKFPGVHFGITLCSTRYKLLTIMLVIRLTAMTAVLCSALILQYMMHNIVSSVCGFIVHLLLLSLFTSLYLYQVFYDIVFIPFMTFIVNVFWVSWNFLSFVLCSNVCYKNCLSLDYYMMPV